MRVVLASGNRGKLRELAALLEPLGVELLPQSMFGVEPVPETGATFVDNALLKARHAAGVARLPALADDSGLEVHVLNGRPGVLSARYAGPEANDEANVSKLLQEMANVPPKLRGARFHCALALVRSSDDPHPLVCEAAWSGSIAAAPAGNGGFGYDPVFFVAELGRTAAQLAPQEKNARSHRAQALRQLVEVIRAGRWSP